jgi:CHAT domain-containing protein
MKPETNSRNDEFTAQRLKGASDAHFQVVHIASHFRFSPGTEADSYLLLGNDQRLKLGDLRQQNYRFDNVDLLTLSACDTGLGGGYNAEGQEIEGFGVIAQEQGAHAVLATLWQVNDRSTSLFMQSLYRVRTAQSLDKATALRRAQMTLLAMPEYRHPYYWAPFVLMGNWR